MSIDATIVGIRLDNSNNSGTLLLEDRPGGIAGQKSLHFDDIPAWIEELVGKEIWGSSDSIIYKGQVIAKRKGYTFVVWTAKELHGLGPQEAKRLGKS